MSRKRKVKLLRTALPAVLAVLVIAAALGWSLRNSGTEAAGTGSGGAGTETAGTAVSGNADTASAASSADTGVSVTAGQIPQFSTEADTEITLAQDASTADGEGVSISGNRVSIESGGTYRLTGTLEEGQLYVEASSDEMVVLVLAGVNITNSSEPAVYIENADYTVVYLEEGTENTLQSGAEAGISQNDEDTASGGALYARDDMGITGTGSLTVLGYINNGIHTSNDLVIEDGTIAVTAINNGIKGKDSVSVTGGSISVVSGGDGIKADDTESEDTGWIAVTGGTLVVDSQSDGIQAETELLIAGGDFSITAGGGSEDVEFADSEGWGQPDSGWDMEEETAVSTKGVKSGGNLAVNGGSLAIDSCDDAVHSNSSITITGGELSLQTGDDGVHADESLVISGGQITVSRSYEGLEAVHITISGGDIQVTASDDGVNANGGSGSGFGFARGGRTEEAPAESISAGNISAESTFVESTSAESTSAESASAESTEEMPEFIMTGGTLLIDAAGDGLDSNGNITIEGGTLVIDGPSDGANGAIDAGTESGGVCVVNGGTVIAVGSAGMAEGFDESSAQYSFLCSLSFQAGDVIEIASSDGNVIYSHTAARSGSSVVFSSAELEQGETYTVSAGGSSTEVTMDSVAVNASGSMGSRTGGMGGRPEEMPDGGTDGQTNGGMDSQTDGRMGGRGGMGGTR